MRWLWVILALAYLLSPYDLIPGIQGAGWIDDIIVLGLLYRYLSKTKRVGTGRKSPGDEQQEAASEGSDSAVPNGIRPKSPHEILGLTPTASQDEIKAAYRKLAGQYHPDKVAHLGKEFQTLAENRFTEIQEAYEKLLLP